MLLRFDRLLLRVPSLPAAVRYWQQTYGARLVREDHAAATLTMRDGGEVVLHADASLPAQSLYLLVDDVRAIHARRAEWKLDFRSPPTRGSRGYFATIRDPFGVVLMIADESLRPGATPSGSPAATAEAGENEEQAPQPTLFGAGVTRHRPKREVLAKVYGQLGRTADDLPYTSHFETLYDAYVSAFTDPKPDHAEVWRHLLNARKAGAMPKLGAARSTPPEIHPADAERLRSLLGDAIGQRDRLPYTTRFDDLVTAFNAGRRRPYSPHQVWRLVASMAK